MPISLSKSEIVSYVGDIVPLHLGFEGESHAELARADIKWSCDSDAVMIRSFSGSDAMSFNNGVLLVLKKVGSAKIFCELEGVIYTAMVKVRDVRREAVDGEMNFYLGDPHNHTTNIHDHDAFIKRTSEFQSDYVSYIKNEGLIDFCVMSDHASVLNDTDFFRNFIEVEKAEPNSAIILSGAEADVTVREYDRFGIEHKNSGEIVTFNTDSYGSVSDWESYYKCFENAPEPIAIFAHPAVIGYSVKGVWNFSFHKNNTPQMLRAIRGIEVINGGTPRVNLMHEFNYSLALDAGFRVSPSASSDSHGPVWGYGVITPKTVIVAPEKSREAFIYALRHNRFYATESGNVKLKYTVNGKLAPADLDLAEDYCFSIELSYFNEDAESVPVSCSVISDGGKTLYTTNDINSSFSFNISSKTARYFYLRLVDSMGRKTWSMPVWTGRAFDEYKEPKLIPIDLSAATAVDELSGIDASSVIDGNVYNVWEGASPKASIVIDLKELKTVSALGNYPRIIERPTGATPPEIRASWREENFTSTHPTAFALYTSEDGEIYEKRAEGVFRIFGGENIVTFEPTLARYVRLDVLSTTGDDTYPALYGNGKCAIGNLTLFE